MKLKQIAHIVKGKILSGSDEKEIQEHVSIDTRTMSEGDIFIAIIGKTQDGHIYAKEAEKKKAGVIIVSQEIEDISVPVILVSDTTEALFALAKHHKNIHFHGLLIAITGSVGKTTTKEMVAHILSQKYRVAKSPGNYNNHIGIPLTLLSLKDTDEICVLELGMNHEGEISRLSRMCEPHVAMITKIGSAHIGFLGSMERIMQAKMEITDGLNDGILLVNGDDKRLSKLRDTKTYQVGFCGTHRNAMTKVSDIDATLDTLSFQLLEDHKKYHFFYPYGGKHLLTNLLLAIEMGILCDVPIELIQKAVREMPCFEKRLEKISLKGNNILIDDTYNASLDSVLADIDYMNLYHGKKLFIFGDILEVGTFGKKIHREIAKKLRKCHNLEVLCVGEETKQFPKLLKKCARFDTVEELVKTLDYAKLEDTFILVKGSRKMHLDFVAEKIKNEWKLSDSNENN